jgi:3-oxoacyl-[acyl-carrier protein] reductase
VDTHRERVVVITGAAGGIGAATARTLAADGASVIVHDLRREGRLADLAAELGDAAHALSADLSDPAAADALWHEALAWRGHIDVLVNNAGIYEAASLDDELATWHTS